MQELEIKNKRIAITRKNTIQRHSDMDRKILTVKIKIKSCSSLQKEALMKHEVSKIIDIVHKI